MPLLKIIKFKTSKLNLEYANINSIELSPKVLGVGAFGKVYCSEKVDGKENLELAIKIFEDDGHGSAVRGIATIEQLQNSIIEYQKTTDKNREKPLNEVSGLAALPQFSFYGKYDGKDVIGYAAKLLGSDEWIEFSRLFNEDNLKTREMLKQKFYNHPISNRFKLAYDLVEAFSYLEKMKFIYADLNPKNFFINLKSSRLCLIDFEGGAVNDNPEVYGKPGEWLAPEIQDQILMNKELIKVDTSTDTWAVAVGIHFLLFPFHPLFFLKVRGKLQMKEYFNSYKWPSGDKSSSNFRLPEHYKWYLKYLQENVPDSIRKAFSNTFNSGYYNPNLRVSYKQWINIIGALMKAPVIESFLFEEQADRKFLRWKIEGASKVTIQTIGDVTTRSNVEIFPSQTKDYILIAENVFGRSTKSVSVKVTPAPEILIFELSRTRVKSGSSSELTWKTKYAHAVFLDYGSGRVEVPSSGKKILTPLDDQKCEIILVALDGLVKKRQTILLNVVKPVTIVNFTSSETHIKKGEVIRLTWGILNANSTILLPINRDVSNQSSIELPIDKSSVFSLTAKNEFHSESKNIEVTVIPNPEIIGFRPRLKSLPANSSTELVWKIEHAHSAKLDDGISTSDIPLSGSLLITPSKSQKFKLTVLSLDLKTTVEETTSITVIQPVNIRQFGAVHSFVQKGQSTNLTWIIDNAAEVILLPNHVDVSGLEKYEVSPDDTTIYILTAKNAMHSVSKTCQIDVGRAPTPLWKPISIFLGVIVLTVLGWFYYSYQSDKLVADEVYKYYRDGQKLAFDDCDQAAEAFRHAFNLNSTLPTQFRLDSLNISAEQYESDGNNRCAAYGRSSPKIRSIIECNYKLAAALRGSAQPKTCK
ncbi:protein kinase family protein [Dyadobacter aurulentus]|uniref:protein kinase family protein n=1 Tax=Dyadobacter sp. UC 10 TaxID=2605428 RepID=UPI0011F1D123|nr:protein kinase family protein [Dyadobacter sp. UC 10]KAA0989278.1 protein kinase family protein [Dyadobacter sp. UC 10]